MPRKRPKTRSTPQRDEPSRRVYRLAGRLNRPPRERQLTIAEIKTLSNYLKSPTSTGLWLLKADWRSPTGISEVILRQLEAHFRRSKFVTIRSAGEERRVLVRPQQRDEIRDRVVTRLSFLNYLFLALHSKNKASVAIAPDEVEPTYELALSLLDLAVLRRTYKQALEIFSQRIYHTLFRPRIFNQKPFFVRDGFLVLRHEDDTRTLTSLQVEPLRAYSEFLSSVGKVAKPELIRIFSPEEEVFSPYFVLLKLGARHVIGESGNTQLLAKAFEEYDSQSHTNCISTIGLLAEDYLERVYETFFRELPAFLLS